MAFGGVWKASLTELSGGQRSLLALSLILAMLLFKPAPIYILDEVPCSWLRAVRGLATQSLCRANSHVRWRTKVRCSCRHLLCLV